MSAVPSAYEFIQPAGGKTIIWQPLKTKDELQILATYRSEANRHLQSYARLAARVVSIDGEKKTLGPNDFGEWEDFDTNAFADEVNLREAERAAALSKKTPEDARAALDAAAEQAMASIANLQASIVLVRTLAHAASPQ